MKLTGEEGNLMSDYTRSYSKRHIRHIYGYLTRSEENGSLIRSIEASMEGGLSGERVIV